MDEAARLLIEQLSKKLEEFIPNVKGASSTTIFNAYALVGKANCFLSVSYPKVVETMQKEREKRLKWAKQLRTISEGIVHEVVSEECHEERAALLVKSQHALSVAMEALWKIQDCYNIVDCKKAASKAVAEVQRVCSEGNVDSTL